MENQNIETTTKIGAYTALIGALCMLAGATFWGISGADLEKALYNGDIANYLINAQENYTLVIANISIWIIGVTLIGIAGTMMVKLCVQRQAISTIAMYIYWIALPLVIASYVAMLTVVVQLSPDISEATVSIAGAMGWFGTRVDWIATIFMLGIGPALISVAGRGDWVPNWLARWGFLALFASLLTAVAMFMGGLTTYGFLIVPVGLSWTIAASIVLFRRIGKPPENVIAQ